MSESKEAVKKTSWWSSVKAEFKKIIWPDKPTLVRETVAVIVVTIILAIVIVAIDYIVKAGINLII